MRQLVFFYFAGELGSSSVSSALNGPPYCRVCKPTVSAELSQEILSSAATGTGGASMHPALALPERAPPSGRSPQWQDQIMTQYSRYIYIYMSYNKLTGQAGDAKEAVSGIPRFISKAVETAARTRASVDATRR